LWGSKCLLGTETEPELWFVLCLLIIGKNRLCLWCRCWRWCCSGLWGLRGWVNRRRSSSPKALSRNSRIVARWRLHAIVSSGFYHRRSWWWGVCCCCCCRQHSFAGTTATEGRFETARSCPASKQRFWFSSLSIATCISSGRSSYSWCRIGPTDRRWSSWWLGIFNGFVHVEIFLFQIHRRL